mmetsp:Transcript_28854/g.48499  ORF Transcript_28854/g.48499 Transcript_28854/m.48499 type:complete len:256 (+) Transcript_28854:92-859(+)
MKVSGVRMSTEEEQEEEATSVEEDEEEEGEGRGMEVWTQDSPDQSGMMLSVVRSGRLVRSVSGWMYVERSSSKAWMRGREVWARWVDEDKRATRDGKDLRKWSVQLGMRRSIVWSFLELGLVRMCLMQRVVSLQRSPRMRVWMLLRRDEKSGEINCSTPWSVRFSQPRTLRYNRLARFWPMRWRLWSVTPWLCCMVSSCSCRKPLQIEAVALSVRRSIPETLRETSCDGQQPGLGVVESWRMPSSVIWLQYDTSR